MPEITEAAYWEDKRCEVFPVKASLTVDMTAFLKLCRGTEDLQL
jgi:hypothetical protein